MRTYLVSARMHLVSAGSQDTYMYIRMYQGYIQQKKTKHNAQQTLRVPHTHSTRATSKNKKGTERPAHAHGATHAQGSSAI